jgi:hypothetical protein
LDYPAMYTSLNVLGSVVIDIDSSRADVTFLDDSGVRQDYFTLLKSDQQIPVPVELSLFTALVSGSNVQLKWLTETETNNFGFQMERSTSAAWDSIGFVQGHGTVAKSQSYQFSDDLSDIMGKVREVKYRLKQIDTDGSYVYSQVLKVTPKLPQKPQLNQNYPNPFNPSTTISYLVPTPGFVTLKIYDTLGRELYTLVNEFQKANAYAVNFDASEFSSGIYFYALRIDNDLVQAKKLLFVK